MDESLQSLFLLQERGQEQGVDGPPSCSLRNTLLSSLVLFVLADPGFLD